MKSYEDFRREAKRDYVLYGADHFIELVASSRWHDEFDAEQRRMNAERRESEAEGKRARREISSVKCERENFNEVV